MSAPEPMAGPVLSRRVLRPLRPYGRDPARRGAHLLGPLRARLLGDGAGIDDLPLWLTRCIEIQAANGDLAQLEGLLEALRARHDPALIAPLCLTALLHHRAFDSARALAAQIAARQPGDMEAQTRLAQMELLSGQRDAGLARLKTALPHLPGKLRPVALWHVLSILIEEGEASWLAPRLPAATRAQLWQLGPALHLRPARSDLPILCLNLARDTQRLMRARRSFAPAGEITRIAAIEAADTRPEAGLSAGETACAQSHRRAWQRAAETLPDDGYALVIEDDARPYPGPGIGLNELAQAARIARAGLVFVNKRGCEAPMRSHPWQPGQVPRILPLSGDLDLAPYLQNPGWGADGYLLSGAGARALLAAFDATGILGSVDWQMLLMSRPALPDDWRCTHNAALFDRLRARAEGWPVLPGHVTNLPIIHCRDFGYSAINAAQSRQPSDPMRISTS